MHVAVDARPLGWAGEGGIQRVCANLLTALSAEAACHLTLFTNRPPRHPMAGVEVRVLPGSLARYAMVDLPRAVRRSGADVLLGLAPEIHRPVIPSVLMIYDVYAMFYSRWLAPAARLSPTYWRQVAAARLRLAGLRRLCGAVSISQHTADDVRRLRPGLHLPMVVAAPAADPRLGGWTTADARRLVGQRFGLDQRFVLYTGAVNAQKNVRVLVEAFRIGRSRRVPPAARLVIVGKSTWPPTRLDLSGLADAVTLLPAVSDEELGALYAGCEAFVQPSLYEGFGLPVLEAMAAGAPVLVAETSCLPEVAGEAGVLFHPQDATALADHLAAVLTDPVWQDQLRRRSRLRAGSFSWGAMAATTRRALEDAAHVG